MAMKSNMAGLAGVGALAMAGLAAAPAPAQAQAQFNWTCAHDQPITPGNEGYKEIHWQEFKRLVEERSKGRIAIKVVGAGQMGETPQLLDNMRIGTIDCTDTSGATGGQYHPEVGILSVPYVVQSVKHRALLVDESRLLYAEVSKVIKAKLNATTVGTQHAGVRSVYTRTKPIKTPEDLKGLKIRTMPSKNQVEGWKALGALPTVVAFSEVYGALQTGTVDAAESSPMFFWGMKHYETAKFYSLTNHLLNMGWTLVSDRSMDKLPKDLQDIVKKSASEASAKGRQYDIDSDEGFLKRLIAAGVIVNEVDTAPFVKLAEAAHDSLAKEFGGEKILQIARDEAKLAK